MLSLLCVSTKIMSLGERVVLGVDLLCNDLAMSYFFIWTSFYFLIFSGVLQIEMIKYFSDWTESDSLGLVN